MRPWVMPHLFFAILSEIGRKTNKKSDTRSQKAPFVTLTFDPEVNVTKTDETLSDATSRVRL